MEPGGTAAVGGNAGSRGGLGGAGTGGQGGASGTDQSDGGQGAVGSVGSGGAAGVGGECGHSVCGDECVDVQSSPRHCGECGHECDGDTHVQTLACVQGVCQPVCEQHFASCRNPPANQADDGCETDLRTTGAHCGSCERACRKDNASGTSCIEGECQPVCKTGFADCVRHEAPVTDDGCETNVRASAEHCGECGRDCGSGDCRGGRCEGLSCAGLAGTECLGESCCLSIDVPPGRFDMGRGTGADACPTGMTCADDEQPEHEATLSAFALDKYEVTVGRFRAFVEAFGDGWRPSEGEGAHPSIPGTGWQASYQLSSDKAELEGRLTCSPNLQTWQPPDGMNADDAYPMNCVNWYEAFAFCVWDGGRLPTEAEWEMAAVGGSENRLYSWGSAAPTASSANWSGSANSPFVPVGTYQGTSGMWNGLWGHADLAGSLNEWAFDYYSDHYEQVAAGCANCCNLDADSRRVWRGGNFAGSGNALRSAQRGGSDPTQRYGNGLGLRCARTVFGG